MASSDVKTQVVTHVMTYYHMQQSDAEKIYNDTYSLYHHLSTLTDFASLNSVDDKILSSLIIIIQENFGLNDANR
jgi:hypothetical protein